MLLEVRNLRTYLYTRFGTAKAVDGVSFSLAKGDTLAIVGESGCGKTMTALSLMRLVPDPIGKIVGGQILLEGEDLLLKSEKEMQEIRGRKISMIFQDSLTTLNPVFSIGDQLAEAIRIGDKQDGTYVQERAIELLTMVGIDTPITRMKNYPHELSGGMRQRVLGAIALALQPRIVIADEPTSALDVTVQAQYLKTLEEVQRRTGISLIFITHDFGIVARLCKKVCVMYAGRLVETGDVRDIFNQPAHPYSAGLLSCVPQIGQNLDRLASIAGQPPSLISPPKGCAFALRCYYAKHECHELSPPWQEISDTHKVSCWRSIGK